MANRTGTSRRNFLRTAPLAAAATLGLAEQAFAQTPAPATAPAPSAGGPDTFEFISHDALVADVINLMSDPGNNNLVTNKNFTLVLTTEVTKSAKDFEWHEGRDHLVLIVDGSTVYEVGGTPVAGRNTKPGEWLAGDSTGATKLKMTKGDLLTIPRGTPHKRSTETSVTFMLISPMGTVKA